METNVATVERIQKQFKQLNIIPLYPKTKLYNGKLSGEVDDNGKYTWKPYQTLAYPHKLLRDYKGNLAVILGDPYGEGKYLVQIDIDDPELIKYFKGSGTLINKSGNGYHVFIYTKTEEPAKNNYPIKGIEIRTHSGQYCPIPPSIHPNGSEYTVYEDNPILGFKDGTAWVKERLKPLEKDFVKEVSYNDTRPFPAEDDRKLSENTIDMIVAVIRKMYKPDYRNNIIYSLSGLMKKEFVSLESATTIVKRLSATDPTDPLKERMVVLNKTYESNKPLPEIKGMKGIRDMAETFFNDNAQAESFWKQLSGLISAPPGFNELARSIGDSTAVVINKQWKRVVKRTYNTNKKGETISNDMELINAFPVKVKIILSPLEGEDRMFDIMWESRDSPRPIHTGPGTGEEIIDQLKGSSYTTNARQAYELIGPIMSAYQRAGNAELTTDTEKPGIYSKKKEGICAINFELEDYTKKDIKKALRIIERLGFYYKDDRDKLSTSIKWGLVSAFAYALKSSGRQWMPGLAHIGTGKTGKTTLGLISLSFWVDDPKQAQTVAGGFDTPYRMGEALSKSTFPVLINELAGVFEKIEMVEILKSAIEQTTSRAKGKGGRLKHIPALALPLITSNSEMPNDDALRRRIHTLHYTYGEQRQEEDIKKFEEEFKINKGNKTELTKLKVLGSFIVKLIKENPKLLDMNWKDLGDHLINEMYDYVAVTCPEWLSNWGEAETLEDLKEDRVDELREGLLDDINDARARFWRTSGDTDGMLETFAEEGYIPWLKLHVFKDKTHGFAIGSGFMRSFNKKTSRSETLKGISEILGWGYAPSRLAGPGKWILVSEEDLELFLFQRYGKQDDREEMEL